MQQHDHPSHNQKGALMDRNRISVISDRVCAALPADDILYVRVEGRRSVIYLSGNRHYRTYTPINTLELMLGGCFIRIDRSCLVSARAIYAVGDKIELLNGETLEYTHRRRQEIRKQLHKVRRQFIEVMETNNAPHTPEEYHRHYASFDHVPFAFADIEMVFSEKQSAVDWIFCYGNSALAEIEKLPLEQLIGHTFSGMFPNMDAKWLRIYERTALYGETLEITDYSPEIDTDLKVICFPTFKGHCGCILFDRAFIQTAGPEPDGALPYCEPGV